MNLLLAIDGSPHSQAASQFIKNIEFPTESSLQLLRVIDPKRLIDVPDKRLGRNKQTSSIPIQSKVIDEARALLNEQCRNMENPNFSMAPLVSTGIPGEEILSAIDRNKIDLVVLGTHGRKGVNRFLLGSVSEWVLAEASCSTLIVRSMSRSKKSKPKGIRILLATDGSTDAESATNFLKTVSFPQSSKLTLLHVVKKNFYQTEQLVTTSKNTQADFTAKAEDLLQARGRKGAQLLHNIRTIMEEKGLKVNEHLAFGYEADEIIKCAKRTRTDLIVLGSRGLTGVRKFLLGSVSSKVARHAPCSVLVVRRPKGKTRKSRKSQV